MAYSNNPWLYDEYGGVSQDQEEADVNMGGVLTWPGGESEFYSDVMGRGGGGGVPTESLPYGNRPAYPVTTGIYGTPTQPRASGMEGNQPSTRLGSRPSSISSGGGAKVPGQAWGASGPTGGYMTAPKYEAPVWDESKISAKAQRAAGPGLRELRKGIQEAQGRYYENPNVRRMTLRDAMAGYGMGLEKVMGGARSQATSEYATEYQSKVQQTLSQYQNAWKEYLYRMTG